MNYENVLNQLQSNELSIEDAYKKLYKPKKVKPGKKAYFVKLRIKVPEEGKGVNTFLRILFAIPIPLIFARIGLRFGRRFIDDDQDINFDEIAKLIKYSKNTRVQVESDDAQVDIKIF